MSVDICGGVVRSRNTTRGGVRMIPSYCAAQGMSMRGRKFAGLQLAVRVVNTICKYADWRFEWSDHPDKDGSNETRDMRRLG